MVKTITSNFVEDLDTTDKAIGVIGFLSSFLFLRFFKNNDDIKSRVRNLEKNHEVIKSEHEFMKNTLINVQEQQKKHSSQLVDIDRDLILLKKDINHTNNNVKGISGQMTEMLKQIREDNQETIKELIKKVKKK